MTAGPELAWRQLIKRKGHFAAALAGVAFAVTLMLCQIGLRDSLLKTAIRTYSHMRADLVMTSWQYQYELGPSVVPQRRFAQARAVDGVASCTPLQIGWLALENPENHQEQQILMLGSDPHNELWSFSDQKVNFFRLNEPRTMIYDAESRSIFGPLPQMFEASNGRLGITASGLHAEIVGLLNLGPGFVNNGSVFVSEATYDEFFAGRSILPSLGAIQLKPGANLDVVLQSLRSSLPNDVRFFAFRTFLENEEQYWLRVSPIGFVFTAGLVLGIVVGSVVVYQILYSDVSNHLPEYATMKAMGYPNSSLFRVIIFQSWFVSVIGFIPGTLMAKAIFVLTQRISMLPLELTPERLALVYLITQTMCTASASLAMLALRSADPAEIF